jgi:hypothetical protein
VVIDHATNNLGNYQGDVINSTISSGYGTQVAFDSSGARSQILINQRIYATGVFDHSVTGALNLSESSSGSSKTWTIASGSITTYHNLAKIKGTARFSNVVYNTQCCLPVSGSISTLLQSTSASTGALAALMNGKTESLTFTGCGTATFVDHSGATSSVVMSNCL